MEMRSPIPFRVSRSAERGRPLSLHIRSLVAVILITLLTSCSSIKVQNSNSSSTAAATSEPKPAASAEEPLFDVAAAWRPKKVVITNPAEGTSPGMRYTINPKAGVGFVALEMVMKREDPAKPVSANFSKIVLIDSAGGRREPLFSYPSAVSKYMPNGDSIVFSDDPNRLIGGKLSELGGKLIAVFEAPPAGTAFEVSVGAAPAVHIDLGNR